MTGGRLASARKWGSVLSFGVLEQILLSGSSFAFTAVMARSLGGVDFGWFSVAFACLMLMEVGGWGLFGDGVPSTAERIPARRRPAFRASFLLLSAGYALAAFALAAIAAAFLLYYSTGLASLALATGTAFSALRMQNAARRLYYLDRERKSAALAATINVILLAALTAAVLLIGRATPALAMACLAGASAAAAAFFVVSGRTLAVAWPSLREFHWARQRLWLTGRWLLASGAMSWIGNYGAVLMVGFLIGIRSSGTLRAALTLITPPSQMNNVLMSIIVPENAAALRRERDVSWWRLQRRALLLIGGCTGSYALFATAMGEHLPRLLFGAIGAEITWETVAVTTIGFALESVRYSCNTVLFAAGRTWILSASTGCSLIVGLLGICLASGHGLTAVLLAMTIGNNTGTVIVLIYFTALAQRRSVGAPAD